MKRVPCGARNARAQQLYCGALRRKEPGEQEVSAVERERNARAQQLYCGALRRKTARFNAQVTEWLMVADCKSAALRSYGGSNPPLCTRLRRFEGVSKALAEQESSAEIPSISEGYCSSASCKCRCASVFMWHSRYTQF
jgi:hypothetical protein